MNKRKSNTGTPNRRASGAVKSVNLNLPTIKLEFLAVRIMRKFKDQFVYLSYCASLKKLLINQVIDPQDKEFKVVISEGNDCSLLIVSLKTTEEEATEIPDMNSLSISDDLPTKTSRFGFSMYLHSHY